MFYPTGKSTKGRTLVSVKDYEGEIIPMEESENDFLVELNNWLEENKYCVEKSELKEFMEDCGFCSNSEIAEMEGGGGAPMDGGAFATLGTTPGMGEVMPPSPDGALGSGDKFDTLKTGTPAAKDKKGKKKKLSIISDFDSFIKAMKVNQ